jgi:S1-C subfamily serine protease
MYKKVSPCVVGIAYGTQNKGTGFVVDRRGLIVSSIAATGTDVSIAYVYLGHKRYKGRILRKVRRKELVIIKIPKEDLPALELGDSDKVKIGDVAYVLGDSFDSIFKDGQVAISFGTISDMYKLRELRGRDTFYRGKVIETTAAVNPNQSGAPLIDAKGRVIGMITLNYSDAKLLGVAIPINELKDIIEQERAKLAKKPPRKY